MYYSRGTQEARRPGPSLPALPGVGCGRRRRWRISYRNINSKLNRNNDHHHIYSIRINTNNNQHLVIITNYPPCQASAADADTASTKVSSPRLAVGPICYTYIYKLFSLSLSLSITYTYIYIYIYIYMHTYIYVCMSWIYLYLPFSVCLDDGEAGASGWGAQAFEWPAGRPGYTADRGWVLPCYAQTSWPFALLMIIFLDLAPGQLLVSKGWTCICKAIVLYYTISCRVMTYYILYYIIHCLVV